MSAWLGRLPAAEIDAAAPLRLLPGADVCITDGAAWLRGPRLDDDVSALLRLVPGLERLVGDPGGPAIRVGRQLPEGLVPEDGWSALRQVLTLQTPRCAFPGLIERRCVVRLVRSASEQPCTLLLCTWAAWAGWVDHAPEHRLARLRFVVDRTRRVLVQGHPLPPLPGQRLWQLGPLAIPAGEQPDPPIDAATAVVLCAGADDDVVLVDAGGWQRIAASHWAAASRSAVRADGVGDG